MYIPYPYGDCKVNSFLMPHFEVNFFEFLLLIRKQKYDKI